MKTPDQFLVNSAAMIAMLVKLLLVLTASNTSPATSLKVSFSRSKYAICCKRFSFSFPTFLLLSFFFCAIVDLSQCEMETSFSSLLVLLPAYLRLFGSFSWSVLARSWASWKFFSSSLAERVLEYGLLYKLRNARGMGRNGHRGTQRQFSEKICSEDDLRSRSFGTFVVKLLACLPLLGFSNI